MVDLRSDFWRAFLKILTGVITSVLTAYLVYVFGFKNDEKDKGEEPEKDTAIETEEPEPRKPEPEKPEPRDLRGQVLRTDASTQISARYAAGLATDGDPRTAWGASNGNHGRGEHLEVVFARPQHIHAIEIHTGFDRMSEKFGDLFKKNAHLKTLRIAFDDDPTKTRKLDIAKNQRVRTIEGIDLVVTRVRFIVDDVWEGDKYEDLHISEIAFSGWPAGSKGSGGS